MPTLREFITENTFSETELNAVKDSITALASGRVKNDIERPSTYEVAASNGLTRYYHHQRFLQYLIRNCPDKLDTKMTGEDMEQLGIIGATVLELKFFV